MKIKPYINYIGKKYYPTNNSFGICYQDNHNHYLAPCQHNNFKVTHLIIVKNPYEEEMMNYGVNFLEEFVDVKDLHGLIYRVLWELKCLRSYKQFQFINYSQNTF